MERRKIVAVLMAAVQIFILSGCISDDTAKESSVNDIVKLTVLAGQSTSDAGIEDMINEALEEQFPNVELQWECVDWGEQFGDLMQARISAHDIPDIMIGKAQDIHTYASSGNLAEIPETCITDISDEALAAVTIDGKVYGVPYNAWYQGIVYNKDIFRIYDLEVPKTIEELDYIIRILKENSVTPYASHFQESWKVGNMTMQFLMNDVFRYDSNWGQQFRAGETGFSVDDRVRRCLLNNSNILKDSWEDALLIGQAESDQRFSEGKAAMYITGSWSMQFVSQYGEGQEFGIFPYPNESGDACLIRETNMTLIKSAKTEHSDLIDEIFTYLISDKSLMEEILDFTQTSSVCENVNPKIRNILQDDIDLYEERGQVIEVTAGNAQLIWPFQNEVAAKQLQWLQGQIDLEEVLLYADEIRADSSY